ncbi:hypothetical protein RMQ97_05110 [Maricaulis sp. D1M11]
MLCARVRNTREPSNRIDASLALTVILGITLVLIANMSLTGPADARPVTRTGTPPASMPIQPVFPSDPAAPTDLASPREQPRGMDNAFGHIVRVHVEDTQFDALFSADGGYADSRGVAGRWRYDGQLCITVNTRQGPSTNCGPWNPDLVAGDVWQTGGWSDDDRIVRIELIPIRAW